MLFTSFCVCVFFAKCVFYAECVFSLCRSLRIASSSARSVVIISFSSLEAFTTTGTLLLLELMSASPRSKRVMARISVRVSFSVSCT